MLDSRVSRSVVVVMVIDGRTGVKNSLGLFLWSGIIKESCNKGLFMIFQTV